MIQINQLKKGYSGRIVLDIPSLTISDNEIFGLVGNNGAGKTTLFSLILDLIRATEGEVLINHEKVSESENWKKHVGAYLDESFLIGYLSADEYFSFIGKLRGMNEVDVKDFLAPFEKVFNGEVTGRKTYLRNLSKGNQKKAGIVGALMGNPDYVLLDEPFANLDPSTQFYFRNLLAEYGKQSGKTLLVSSHDLIHVAEICTRIVILEKGLIVKDVPRSEISLQALEEFFIGEIIPAAAVPTGTE